MNEAIRPESLEMQADVLYEATVSGGHQVVVRRTPGRATVCLALQIPVGALHIAPGAAHLIEHLLFWKLSQTIEEAQAQTRHTHTILSAQGYYQEWERLLQELLEVWRFPQWDESLLEQEVSILQKEWNSLQDNLNGQVYREILHALYPHDQLYDRLAGTPEAWSELTLQRLEKEYERLYRTAPILVEVQGDVEPEKVIEAVELLLKGCPPPSASVAPCAELLQPPHAKMAVGPRLLPSAGIGYLAGKAPALSGPAFLKREAALRVGLDWLVGSLGEWTRRLYQQGLLAGPLTHDLCQEGQISYLFCGGLTVAPERLCKALHELQEELQHARISEDAFAESKRQVYGHLALLWDSPDQTVYQDLRFRLAGGRLEDLEAALLNLSQGDVTTALLDFWNAERHTIVMFPISV